jgi:hypothetical protein
MDPVIDTTLRAALALLFLAAAAHKARDLARFRATLADYRLLPDTLVPVGAVLVTGAETAVAAALVTPGLRAPGLLSAAGLLLVYGAAIAINLARGRHNIDCGCAGPAGRRPLSAALVVRNAVLAATTLAGFAPVRPRTLVWVDALTVAGGTAMLAALYASLDRLIAQAPVVARLRGGA